MVKWPAGRRSAAAGSAKAAAVAPGWREAVAVWCGRLLVVAAVWSLISIPLIRWAPAGVVADGFSAIDIPADPSLFVVCLTLALAGAIRRRFRAAHLVLVGVMALTVLADGIVVAAIATGTAGQLGLPKWRVSLPVAAFVLATGLVARVAVALARRAFPARLARGSWWAALGVLAGGLALSFAVTFALTMAFPRTLHGPGQKAGWALRSAFGNTAAPDDPFLGGHAGYHWEFTLAGLMSAGALVLALLVFWRAGRSGQHQNATEELAVRRLLLQHGESDSLGYFATRRDKSVIFAPDGRAAITYRVVGSVSVASADPIGARASWRPAIQAWLTECRIRGWYAAVLSASEAGTREYSACGLRALAIGDEAIIDADRFSLKGRQMRPVRQAVTRITRAGYSTQVQRHSELSAAELAEIERLADEWRGEETERGFSMALNRLGDPADGRCVVIRAYDRSGRLRGLLSFVPLGVRGISLDLMRRDRSAENGLNEFMVARLAQACPAMGVRRISLNFAVFRTVFSTAEQVGAGPVTRVTDKLLGFASRFYQMETLYRSNDKYRPDWVPRLLCYDPALTVVRAGLAMGVAEGFVPRLGPRLLIGPRIPDAQPPREEPDFIDRVRRQERELLRPAVPKAALSEQQRVRRDKLAELERSGMPGYPVRVPRTHSLREIQASYAGLAAGARTGAEVSVTGRIRALRDLGGVAFAVLEEDGARVQVMTALNATPTAARDSWDRSVDIGDLVSVTGEVIASERGELSVLLRGWAMAGKCLSPVPYLRARLAGDVRARDRSLDLITSPDAVDLLRRRSRGVRALREALQDRDFTEVETPMLQAVHGGAAARPFLTHINAYDMELFLRIAPELYLKRLCVGGMRRIFELNRSFRNEGADATHNPEFTSLEAYQAYADYHDMRELTRAVILRVATAVNGRPVALRPDGTGGGTDEIDLTAPWPVLTVHEAVSKAAGVQLTPGSDRDEIAEVCAKHHVPAPAEAGPGRLVMDLYEALVEKQTGYPTFYCDFPVEVSPLARRHRDDPRLTEQWDLVAFGVELGTAYSELTDPIDQRERLTRQSLAAAAGDPDAMRLDESFLAALSYAMPPTGGLGLGVDRLIMMLAGVSIRATLAFPFVRPQDQVKGHFLPNGETAPTPPHRPG
ncbi:MAG TPA: bifunctional lysylphosphatidylglycerol synthetase/lysine--tRNA ligase LysX [Streptosporangiaceae bacterium]